MGGNDALKNVLNDDLIATALDERTLDERPLDVTALAGSTTYDGDTLRELTHELMQRIAAMLPPAYRGVYA